MIEDILVLEAQDSDPSLVVVAVSGGEPTTEVIACGWPSAVLAVGARGIQRLLVLKALVLLDAGEGLTVDAFEQIDLGDVVFNYSFIFLITNSINTLLTVQDTRNDSYVTAVCPKADLLLALGQASLGVIHTPTTSYSGPSTSDSSPTVSH